MALLAAGLVMFVGAKGQAETGPSLTAGIRVGYSDSEYKGIFRQVEGMVRYDLEPFWQDGPTWALRTGVDILAGSVGNHLDTAVLVGGGVHLSLGLWRDRLAFDTGTSVAMLTDHTFGPRISLGTPAQFITHWRLRWWMFDLLGVAYRYQHMSNGGLGLDNPGLNLHMLELTIGR